MSEQDQIKALAELDGFKFELVDRDVVGFPYRWFFRCPPEKRGNQFLSQGNVDDGVRSFNDLPNYLTSYDAIILLIQKQPRQIINKISLWKELFVIMSTPAQLSEALIRAHGLWKE
jgi:predicted oxidoreductase